MHKGKGSFTLGAYYATYSRCGIKLLKILFDDWTDVSYLITTEARILKAFCLTMKNFLFSICQTSNFSKK